MLSLRRPGYLSRYNDSLRDGRSGHRIPVGERISVPVQESPETHPASSTMVTVFSAGRAAGDGADPTPPPFGAEFANRLVLYLVLPYVPAKVCHGVTFTIT